MQRCADSVENKTIETGRCTSQMGSRAFCILMWSQLLLALTICGLATMATPTYFISHDAACRM